MVQYKEVARAVTNKIKEAFPDALIYADEVKEGYKKPFFIGILPVNSINHTKSIIEDELLITISYSSDTVESIKNLQVMQELKVAIGHVGGVDNRSFTIGEIETQKVEDDIYQITFSIDYYYTLAINEPDSVLADRIIYNKKGAV